MVATFPSSSTNDFSSQNLNVEAMPVAEGAKGIAARKIAQRDSENFRFGVDTLDTHSRALRRATCDAIAARKIAQRDYKKVQAEADRWERRLQSALKDDREDLVREALLHTSVYRDRARQVKALAERHSIQVSTLKSQLAFWENQL
jgi:hypothetical protein